MISVCGVCSFLKKNNLFQGTNYGMLLSAADCRHYAIRPVAPVSSSAGNTTPHDPYYTDVIC